MLFTWEVVNVCIVICVTCNKWQPVTTHSHLWTVNQSNLIQLKILGENVVRLHDVKAYEFPPKKPFLKSWNSKSTHSWNSMTFYLVEYLSLVRQLSGIAKYLLNIGLEGKNRKKQNTNVWIIGLLWKQIFFVPLYACTCTCMHLAAICILFLFCISNTWKSLMFDLVYLYH